MRLVVNKTPRRNMLHKKTVKDRNYETECINVFLHTY